MQADEANSKSAINDKLTYQSMLHHLDNNFYYNNNRCAFVQIEQVENVIRFD